MGDNPADAAASAACFGPGPGPSTLALGGGPPGGGLVGCPPGWGRAGGLAGNALAAALPRSRPGDPLGLGLGPGPGRGARPPPPPDPDPYDRAAEDAGGGRSLLTPEERAVVDAEGPLDIAGVRRLLAENLARTDEAPDLGRIDAEIAFQLDARISFKVFLAGDNAYTREELFAAFPFQEFGTCPEAVFAPQLVGVFPPLDPADGPEFVLRDADDDTLEGFCPPADLIRPPRGGARAPLRVVSTKIFVGKERWDDFCALHRTVRGAVRVAAAQGAAGPGWLALGGGPGWLALGGLLGGALGGGGPPPLLGPPAAAGPLAADGAGEGWPAAAEKGPAAAEKGPAAAEKGPAAAAEKGPAAAAEKGPAAAERGPAAAEKGPAAAGEKGPGRRAKSGGGPRARARARARASRLGELEGRVARLELTLLRSAVRALRGPSPGRPEPAPFSAAPL